MKKQTKNLLCLLAFSVKSTRQVCALLALAIVAFNGSFEAVVAQPGPPPSSPPELVGSPRSIPSPNRDFESGPSIGTVPSSQEITPAGAEKVEPATEGSVSTVENAEKPKKEKKNPPTLKEALASRGDLTLRNSTLDGALYTISELFEVNIVTGRIEGQVNGVFRQTPLHEILDGILLSNGYGYRLAGESLIIARLSEMGQVNPFFESATIQVKTARVSEVLAIANSLKSPQGRVQSIESARSVFVMDFPERVNMMRRVVESIDAASLDSGGSTIGASPEAADAPPLEVASYRTQNIKVNEAVTAVTAVLSNDGTATSLGSEDRLVIVDYPQNVAMAKRLLRSVDVARPMVKITALIYDISVEDIEQLGINWSHSGKTRVDANGDGQSIFSVDSILKSPLTTGGTFTFMNLSRHFDLTAVILAMQNANDSRLLASPFVVVEENEEANFQSVSEIPYQELTQTAAGGNIGTTAFKEAGITLRVTPKISADGTIKMVVTPEFSSLSGFTPGDNQPIIDRRTSTTTLRVADRQTVVIGGLRQRGDVGDFRGVPHLKDMKYVGKLFRARDTTVQESELVVFIVPEIVGCSNPLSYRERLATDTIGCRVDGIPLAEGCVRRLPGCCDAGPGCGIPHYNAPDNAPGQDASVPYDIEPTFVPEAEEVPHMDEALPMPVHSTGIRRLPPVGPSSPAPSVGVYHRPQVDEHLPGPLRPHFSQRFRAANGPATGLRAATRPGAAYSEQSDQVKPSLWNRLLRR